MDHNIHNFRYVGDDTFFDIIGDGVPLPDAYLFVYDNMHVNLNTRTDIAGSDRMDFLDATGIAGNFRNFFLDLFRCAGVDEFTDCRPDNFQGRMQNEN